MQKQSGIDAIQKQWDNFSQIYSSTDSCPQTFFFSLINQLKIRKAQNILEIACGAGLLLPFVIDQKSPNTQYLATDLTDSMIKISQKRLKNNFDKYDSKLTFQNWLSKQKLILKQANGEQPIQGFGKFDRIICNLVLMLTSNPKNILASVYKTSTDDALMGITIWGNKSANNFFCLMAKAIKSLNLPLAVKKSPFDYQEIIHSDLKETGWQIVFEWQQNAPLPFTTPTDIDNHISSMDGALSQFSTQDKIRIKQKMKQIYLQQLSLHNIMQMSTKIIIVKKSK